MSLISIPNTFSAGAVIIASQHNSNFSTIYSDYNGNIDNSNISGTAAIAYSKLSLTGGIVNADISSGATIVDTKLGQITTAGKVSGAALTSLSSTPSGAGVMPIANLATGTPTGIKFIRDDGTLQTVSYSSVAGNYTAGDYLLNRMAIGGIGETDYTSSTSYVKMAEVVLPRGGTLRIKFWLHNPGSTGTGYGRIYRNGSAIGTERSNSTQGGTQYSEDISGWATGDLLQLYAKASSGQASMAGGMQLFTGSPISEAVNFSTYPTPVIYYCNGAIDANAGDGLNIGSIGDTLYRLDGSTSTTLYVKTASTTWTGK